MITRPDEYKHQNDSYAIVDNANVRGGIFDVADLSTANLNTIPVDKRKVRSTMVNGTDSKIYIYTGATLDNTAWGTTGNWVIGSGSSYTHPTGFTNKPSSALTGANVISQITVNDNGHVTGTTTRALSYSDIGAASSSHTHSNATTSTVGFMSTTDKTKLDSITSGAEANQAAFSKVTVGSTTINALTETDTLTLVAGSNITLTPDNLTKSVVVASSGGSSSSYAFGTVAVSGQTNIVADSVNDTLTLIGGKGITLTTTPASDYITITNSIAKPSMFQTYTVTVPTTITTCLELENLISIYRTNLTGNLLEVVFTAGEVYNLTTSPYSIRFSGMADGTVIFRSSSTSIKSTINITSDDSIYAFIFSTDNTNIIFSDLNINYSSAYAGTSTRAFITLDYSNYNGITYLAIYDCNIVASYSQQDRFNIVSFAGRQLQFNMYNSSVDAISQLDWNLIDIHNYAFSESIINLRLVTTPASFPLHDTLYISGYRGIGTILYDAASSGMVVLGANALSRILCVPGNV